MCLLEIGVNTEDIKACHRKCNFCQVWKFTYSSWYSECAACNLFQRVNALQREHDRRRLEMKSAKSWHIYLENAESENYLEICTFGVLRLEKTTFTDLPLTSDEDD